MTAESRLSLICDHCAARSGPFFNVSLGQQCAVCRRGFMRLIQPLVSPIAADPQPARIGQGGET